MVTFVVQTSFEYTFVRGRNGSSQYGSKHLTPLARGITTSYRCNTQHQRARVMRLWATAAVEMWCGQPDAAQSSMSPLSRTSHSPRPIHACQCLGQNE